MSNHAWVQENLAAYVAGGLNAAEKEQLEQHLAECAACAADHEDIRKMEQVMDQLYRENRPDAELEDRVISNLRTVPASRPGLTRFFAAAAAVLVLGLLGAAMQAIAGSRELWFPGTKWAWDDTESVAAAYSKMDSRELALGASSRGPHLDERYVFGKAKRFKESGVDTDIQYNADKIEEISVPGSIGGRFESDQTITPKKQVTLDSSSSMDGSYADWGKRVEERLGTTFYENMTASTDMRAKVQGTHTGSLMLGGEKKEEQLGDYLAPQAKKELTKETAKLEAQPDSLKKGQEVPPKDDGPTVLVGPGRVAILEKKPVDPPTDNPGLKIIRTGEIEFEVESFDSAIDSVTKLIGGVKGGIITKKDSDKLKNGKTAGFIVVRMPPQFLDAFISDLRLALAKTGELKTQRISSQDVTKHYTDNEAALRSARITEQRYLDIIKNGKGEIKELVLAENALAEWRTKIERLEGENRFYNNQVSLSTLTINLTEKDIQTPSALVVSQKIEMNIEVEDVEQAHDAALAAIVEAKGRVTKSERKQYPMGHVKAIVHAEASPTAARALEDRLKKLGIVTQQNTQRSQETQGGVGRPLDLKPRLSDVVLEIELYNSANIRPRETIDMKVVTQDVSGNFRKLQEAVIRLKGQVLDAKLNEQDKPKITAQFDFDISVQDKQAIDKLLGEIGPVVSRSTGQAPPKEVVTDRKVGYRLLVRDVAGIPPREKIALLIEVRDVTAKAAELKKLILEAKGAITTSKLNHDPKGQTNALLAFNVPLSANDGLVKQIKDTGSVRDQRAAQNSQEPENELSTAHIEVVLTNAGPIVPSDEALWTQIRTSLYYSFRIFSWSLMFVILGLSVVLPWALLFWVGFKLVRRIWKKPQAG